MNAVTLAWGKAYWDKLPILKRSCKNISLPLGMKLYGGEPSCPMDAWSFWPILMLDYLRKGPVLKVDCDSRINTYPDFAAYPGDFACFYAHPGQPETAVMLARATPRARTTLETWARLMKGQKDGVDAGYFREACEIVRPFVAKLPATYCWNHKARPELRYGNLTPIVEVNV